VEIEVNTFGDDFMIAISSGILSRHLRSLVTAGKIEKTSAIATVYGL